MNCPCCGKPLEQSVYRSSVSAKLTSSVQPVEAAVFGTLLLVTGVMFYVCDYACG
jgi:hypothetical protein